MAHFINLVIRQVTARFVFDGVVVTQRERVTSYYGGNVGEHSAFHGCHTSVVLGYIIGSFSLL